MTKFKRYDSYKNSGVEWLGEIPNHWEILKLKFIGKIFAGLSDKKGDDFSKEFANDKKPFIPFTNVCNNLKIDKNQMQYVKISPYEMQNKVREKDIIFLMSSETLDDIGKCSIYLEKEQLYLNSFCKGFRPNLFRVNAEFLNYLLQSKTYRNYFNLAGRGFTRINIKQEYIANLLAVLPPKDEQEKIASYLDEKIAKIDTAVSGKEKLIELLKEQKQIIINDAVTKGLNKNAKFKNSGAEWLGEIPSHWEILYGFRVFNENKRKNIGMLDNRVLSLSYGQIIRKSDEKLVGLVPESFETYQIVKTGDIIVRCTDLQNDKVSLRIGLSKYDGIITSAYLNLNVINGNPKYLYYFLYTFDVTKAIYQLGSGLRQSLSYKDFKKLNVLLPPKSEQEKIVKYIENKISKIDKLVNLEQEYIKSLKEYKASLIDSVVTGKVRIA